MKKLTKKQKQVLGFMMLTKKTHGYIPSLREIQSYLNLSSVNSVVQKEKSLIKKGYVALRTDGKRQSIYFPRQDELDVF